MSNSDTRNIKYFYIVHSFPSALFDTLEDAENSAEFQLASHITFYRLLSDRIQYIYTETRESH
jgi:hypothetical protein